METSVSKPAARLCAVGVDSTQTAGNTLEEAIAASSGYDSAIILEKTRFALLKVNGDADNEREFRMGS